MDHPDIEANDSDRQAIEERMLVELQQLKMGILLFMLVVRVILSYEGTAGSICNLPDEDQIATREFVKSLEG